MTDDGYPKESELAEVRELDFAFLPGAERMLDLFEATGIGSGRLNEAKTILTLHTGGWSGCEQLIEEVEHSMWCMRWWYSTTRGGHYVFGPGAEA